MTPPLSENDGEEAFLVQGAKAGDEEAFDHLYRRHHPGVCRYVTNMTGCYEDAQQLTQEIFLAAWQDLPDLRSNESFKHWLYGIATHRALDWIRRKRHFGWLSWEDNTRYLESCDALGGAREASPEDQVISSQITQLALQQVQDSYRACMLLQIHAELPQKDIASLLGISVKSVSVYVKRGLQQFREALELIEQDTQADVERRSS